MSLRNKYFVQLELALLSGNASLLVRCINITGVAWEARHTQDFCSSVQFVCHLLISVPISAKSKLALARAAKCGVAGVPVDDSHAVRIAAVESALFDMIPQGK